MNRNHWCSSFPAFTLAVGLLLAAFAWDRIALAIDLASQARGPIDAVLIDGCRLAVANQDSGSVSLIENCKN